MELYVDALVALLPPLQTQPQAQERNVIRKLEALNERIRHARIAMLNTVIDLSMPMFAVNGPTSARSRSPRRCLLPWRRDGGDLPGNFAKPLKTPDASFRK